MKRLRVVLDANVLAPGLVSSQSSSAEIVRLWRRGLFDVLVTGKLVDEIAKTLRALGLDDAEVMDLIEILGSQPDVIIPLQHQILGCKDANDDYLFETAIRGVASFIVTRDHALLSLPKPLERTLATHQIRVMTDVDFLNYVRRHVFSPLAFDDRLIDLDDIIGPLDDVACVVCGHGFHWDVECGLTVTDQDGEPWLCECPAKVGFAPA
jgi:putative PIN family toxin of toxin-antitoxin system